MVQTDVESHSFGTARGLRQADPILALLFAAVMHAIFGTLGGQIAKGNVRRHGVKSAITMDASKPCLTDPMFACDVMSFSQQGADIVRMLQQLDDTSAK